MYYHPLYHTLRVVFGSALVLVAMLGTANEFVTLSYALQHHGQQHSITTEQYLNETQADGPLPELYAVHEQGDSAVAE